MKRKRLREKKINHKNTKIRRIKDAQHSKRQKFENQISIFLILNLKFSSHSSSFYFFPTVRT